MNAITRDHMLRQVHEGSIDHRIDVATRGGLELGIGVARQYSTVEKARAEWCAATQLWSIEPLREGDSPRLDVRDQEEAHTYAVGAAASLGLDLVVAAAISVEAFDMPPGAAIGIGWGTSVGTAALVAACFATLSDRQNPRTSVDRLKRWALATGGLTIGTIIALNTERLSASALTWFPVLLACLAAVLPVAAGAFYECSRQIGFRNRLFRVWDAATRELANSVAARAELKRREISLRSWKLRDKSTRAPRPTNFAAAIVLAIAIVAATRAGAATPRSAAEVELRTEAGDAGFVVDGSGSLDAPEAKRTSEAIAASLPQFAQAVRPRAVFATLWASKLDTLRGNATEVVLPMQSKIEPPPATREAKWIRAVGRAVAEEEKRKRESEQAHYESSVAAALEPIQRALRSFEPRKQAPASCIDAMISRLLAEPAPTISVLITDGDSFNCPATGRPPTSEAKGLVLVVLVPGAHDGEPGRPSIDERRARLIRSYPAITIVPSYRVRAQTAWWEGIPMSGHGAAADVEIAGHTSAPRPSLSGEAVAIISPAPGSSVEDVGIVEATVESDAQVVLAVNPPRTPFWWIQRATTLTRPGTYRGVVHYGTETGGGIGTDFDVVAFAVPDRFAYRDGAVFSSRDFTQLLEQVPHSAIVSVRRVR